MKSRIRLEKMGKTMYCLSIEMTRRCNMNCDFCARGQAQNVDITHEIIDKTLDEMEDVYIYSLRLSGGEPLLVEEQIEYLFDEIIRRRIHIDELTIFTNGTVRSTRIAESIKKITSYIRSIRSDDIALGVWLLMHSESRYNGTDGKISKIIVSTEGHDVTQENVNSTIEFYKNEINDDNNVAVLNQSESFKYNASKIVIEGNAVKNFDKLFGKVLPSGTRVIDNNYRFINEMVKSKKVTGRFIEKALTVSANGNVFPGCVMPYDRVDKEFMFSIFECKKDFFEKVEVFCWEHPLNLKANRTRTTYKVAQIAQKTGRKIDGFGNITNLLLGYFNSRIDRLEEMMRDFHRLLPNLYFDDIEGIATAAVILEMVEGGENDNIIRSFAETCTELDDDDINNLLSAKYCRGYIKYTIDKDSALAAARQ